MRLRDRVQSSVCGNVMRYEPEAGRKAQLAGTMSSRLCAQPVGPELGD